MKHLASVRCLGMFLLAVALLLCTETRAKCASRWLDIWPTAGPIPPNAVFLIEGYGLDRTLVEQVQSCELVLASDSESVCLFPETKYTGGYGVDQALLRPERSLTPGVTYRIVVSDEGPRAAQWAQGVRPGSEMASTTWLVERARDEIPPVWLKSPRVTKVKIREFGCGPAIGAKVRIVVDDSSPVLVRTTVAGSDASAPQSFLLQPKDGKIDIGHGMCAGGFDLIPGESYRATVSLLDAAGNASGSAAKEIDFKIPKRKSRWTSN